jgi:hypothetical protein
MSDKHFDKLCKDQEIFNGFCDEDEEAINEPLEE